MSGTNLASRMEFILFSFLSFFSLSIVFCQLLAQVRDKCAFDSELGTRPLTYVQCFPLFGSSFQKCFIYCHLLGMIKI